MTRILRVCCLPDPFHRPCHPVLSKKMAEFCGLPRLYPLPSQPDSAICNGKREASYDRRQHAEQRLGC